MKRTLTKFRRRIAYLLLPNEDRCMVSTALSNAHVYVCMDEQFSNIRRYNSLLKEMERIYRT